MKTKWIVSIFLTNLLSIMGGVFIGYQLESFEDSIGWAHGFFLHESNAEQNNPVDQYYAGNFLLEGKGTEINPDKAVFWLTKSANNDYLKAQLKLVQMYETDQSVIRDKTIARQFYKMAADHIQKKLSVLEKEK